MYAVGPFTPICFVINNFQGLHVRRLRTRYAYGAGDLVNFVCNFSGCWESTEFLV